MSCKEVEPIKIGDRMAYSYTTAILGRVATIRLDESAGGKPVNYFTIEGLEYSQPECVFTPTNEELNQRCIAVLKDRIRGKYAGEVLMTIEELASAERALRVRCGDVAAWAFVDKVSAASVGVGGHENRGSSTPRA